MKNINLGDIKKEDYEIFLTVFDKLRNNQDFINEIINIVFPSMLKLLLFGTILGITISVTLFLVLFFITSIF